MQQQGQVGPGLGRLQAQVWAWDHLHTVLMGLPMGSSLLPWEGAMGPWCPAQHGERWKEGLQSATETLSPPESRLMLMGITLCP